MNKKNVIKILLTVMALVVLGFSYWYFNQQGGAKYDGSITFKLIDENGVEVISDTIEYKAETEDGTKINLFDILSGKYDVVCANIYDNYSKDNECGKNSISVYGRSILAIESVETDWYNSYLALYKNGVYANYGVSNLDFSDGDIIEFRYTLVREKE